VVMPGLPRIRTGAFARWSSADQGFDSGSRSVAKYVAIEITPEL